MVVEEALGLLPRRLLALGIELQAKYGRGVTMLRKTYARLLGASEYAVKAALASLRAMGLERWAGFDIRRVPTWSKANRQAPELVREVPVREFMPGVEFLPGFVVPVSPEAVALAEGWLKVKRRGWGGARKGAGRPQKVEEVRMVSNLKTTKDTFQVSDNGPKPSVSEAPPVETTRDLRLAEADFGYVDPNAKLTRRATLTKLGGKYIPLPPTEHHGIHFVRTPPPPKLPADMIDIDAATMLAAAYRGAIDAKFPELGRCYAFLRGDISKNKSYSSLVQAAHFLRDNDISPIAWALFSAAVWCDYEITKGPPTVAFVYSLARMQERQSWFDDEKDAYNGNSSMFTDQLRQLANDVHEMWAIMLRENPSTRPRLMEIVDHYFPGDSYERRWDMVKKAQFQLQRELDEAVRKGVCVWT
jgi:hypothetical protein